MMREVMGGRIREGGRGLLHPNNHPKPTHEGGRESKPVNPHPKPLLVSRPRIKPVPKTQIKTYASSAYKPKVNTSVNQTTRRRVQEKTWSFQVDKNGVVQEIKSSSKKPAWNPGGVINVGLDKKEEKKSSNNPFCSVCDQNALDKYLEQFSSQGEKKTYPVNMSTWRNVLNLAGTDSKEKFQDEDTGGRGQDELKDEFSSVETRFRDKIIDDLAQLYYSEKEYSATVKAIHAKKRPENEGRFKEKRNKRERVKERLDNGERVKERQDRIEDGFSLENLALKPQLGYNSSMGGGSKNQMNEMLEKKEIRSEKNEISGTEKRSLVGSDSKTHKHQSSDDDTLNGLDDVISISSGHTGKQDSRTRSHRADFSGSEQSRRNQGGNLPQSSPLNGDRKSSREEIKQEFNELFQQKQNIKQLEKERRKERKEEERSEKERKPVYQNRWTQYEENQDCDNLHFDLDKIPVREVSISDKQVQTSRREDKMEQKQEQEQEKEREQEQDTFADIIIQELRTEIRELKDNVLLREQRMLETSGRMEQIARENATLSRDLELIISTTRNQAEQMDREFRRKEEKMKENMERLRREQKELEMKSSPTKPGQNTDVEILSLELEKMKRRLAQGEETNKTLENYICFLKTSYKTVFNS